MCWASSRAPRARLADCLMSPEVVVLPTWNLMKWCSTQMILSNQRRPWRGWLVESWGRCLCILHSRQNAEFWAFCRGFWRAGRNMSLAISHAADALERCLKAAAHIDLARARLFLGEDMEGEVPTVGDDGIIAVRHARNPCLVLRGGKKVVGYRLELGKSSQCLLLTGPNAGGKTVVLKTLGLLALLARCGIPIPGGEAPRVDFFEVVLADVGDMQTIVDDLSTYSAHLVASRLMLSIAQGVGPRALVMVDEAGTGTDPQQGAALARAMLEGFLDMGARVVTTTHSNQLKDWAVEAGNGFSEKERWSAQTKSMATIGSMQFSGVLLIKVKSARQLICLDVTSQSDPYVAAESWLHSQPSLDVQIRCSAQRALCSALRSERTQEMEGGQQKVRTKTVKDCANPVWDEVLMLNVRNFRSDVLRLAVWDADTLSEDDKIGHCEIPLRHLLRRASNDEHDEGHVRRMPDVATTRVFDDLRLGAELRS
eukprot:g28264.t1